MLKILSQDYYWDYLLPRCWLEFMLLENQCQGDNFQLCAQLRVCSQAGGNPVYPRFSQPDNSESWDDAGNCI